MRGVTEYPVPKPPGGPAAWHRIRSLWTPETYHGWGLGRRWFEGWYFKMVSADRDVVLALIPGIFHGDDPDDSHSFVQVLDGTAGTARYNRYPPEEFRTSVGRPFWVSVGPNRFTLEGIELDLPGPAGHLRGGLTMGSPRPWPERFFAPGVMGPYTFAPFMQCYHGVLSFDHALTGTLRIGTREVDFRDGRGYTERDWGRRFPRAWIWIQTNHFERPETSLMLSLANVPWLGRAFTGVIAGLHLGDDLVTFATYNGARITRAEVTEDSIHVALQNRRHQLEVRAERVPGAILRSPEGDVMEARVVESMTGAVDVELRERSGSVIFAGRGVCAGTEAVGTLDI